MKQRIYAWLLFCVIAFAIFVLDTVTSADISIPVLYVTLVMVVRRTGATKDIFIAGLACCLLTVVSYGLNPGFSLAKGSEASLIDVLITLFVVASVTYLSIKVVNSETRARKARDQAARTMLGVSISELATSVVHEINQPLGAIGANLAAAKRWLAAKPIQMIEAREAVDAASDSVERAEGVVSGLRRLASVSLKERETFDITQLIRETVNFLNPEIRENAILVRTHFSQTVIRINGDRTLLQQVFINIFSNAIDAMKDDKSDDRSLTIAASVTGELVSVIARDSGPGISSDRLEEIFAPFYTTKPQGLGIGLAISRTIVEAHGGSVRASPNSPHGTVMAIILPKASDRSLIQ
jgi:signal transduction histidine kinase